VGVVLARSRRASTVLALVSLLFVAVIAASATRPWVEFGPRQQVESINPVFGVHTRLTDEVEPWKIQRTF
jgi:hypothetical protein